jgi:Ca-activated chloride channel homolog
MRTFARLSLLAALAATLVGFPGLAIPAPQAAEPGPGSGSGEMLIYPEGSKEPLLLPLKHTRVDAAVSGIVSTVRVTQEFGNPYTHPIEAVYVFPLPHNAAIYAMKMTIGERIVEGKIKLREEARQLYEQAKQAGQTASLLDQERPNIFTQSVANILPGDDIRVEISYFQDLAYQDGRYEYVFPMVVGPRYIPGEASGRSGTGWSPDTTRVPDASRISPPLLPPGLRSGHDIEVHLDLDTGIPFRDLETPSHEIRVDRRGPARALVTLSDQDRIPNKDFILRWKVDQKRPVPGWVAHRDDTGGTFLLLLQPEVDLPRASIAPREYVFVIDSSGSMNGFPLDQCKRVVRRCLKDLKAGDRFQVILFSGSASTLAPAAIETSEENIEKAMAFIDSAEGSGGTEFLPALEKALTAPKDPERSRIVLFLSDGYIGYETQVLKYMNEHRAEANLFPLGVGSSVNRYLIDAMARIGQGEPFYLTPNEDPDPVVNRFFGYVSRPSLTRIEVEFKGVEVSDLEPSELPDLFSGRPLSLVGRYPEGGRGKVVLTGWLAGKPWKQSLDVELPERGTDNPGLACLWARRGIESLTDRQAIGLIPEDEARKGIVDLALRFSLMSAYTSFVAIDSQVRNAGGESQTVAVPVPLPDQVSPLAAPPQAYVTGANGASLGGARFMAQKGKLCEQSASSLAPALPASRPAEGKDSLEREEAANETPKAADKPPVAPDKRHEGPRIEIAELSVRGTLSEDAAKETLEKALEKWGRKDCLRDFRGTLTLTLEVSAEGKVVSARVLEEGGATESSSGSQPVNARILAGGGPGDAASECLVKLARHLSFTASPAKSLVLVKLNFS